MQLETIAAVVRPRRPWEAVDLGFSMARAWWPALVRPWLAIVAPFYFAVTAALFAYPAWALFVVWWLKPLYERVPLFVASRALFGAVPPVSEVRRKMPRLWLSQSLGALTLGRLDPMRSFVAPVGRLEGLRGAAYRRRAAVLKRASADASAAAWLTVACLAFELGTLLALVALLDMLRPETVERSFWEIFAFVGDAGVPLWYYFLAMTLYFVAMSLIEPFYVAGGFALYLNRRTDLEGWDVDLAFRRLARRLRQGEPPRAARRAAALVLVAGGALAFAGAAPVRSQEPAPARDPQEAIAEILSDPEFGTQRTVTTWRPRYQQRSSGDQPDASPELLTSAGAILGAVFELLLWGTLALLAAVFLIAVVRRFYRPRQPPRPPSGDAGPKILCGLDVSPEALPGDVLAAALGKWREGRGDEALSLLYRGALAALVDRRRLPARASWTEEDCLRHLQGPSGDRRAGLQSEGLVARAPLVEYFARLTAVWQRAAYAHRPPSEDEMDELASGWPLHFGAPS